ncbi:MAG: diguanylate cyclase [Bacilli bacterium]|nr:diguanylate cyclase [Bacilli bacterium]
MHKIAFAYLEENPRVIYLNETLQGEFEVMPINSAEKMTKLLHESYELIDALIIDHPSDKEGIDRLFRYVGKRNSFMFTLPILLLTDDEHKEDDCAYLSDLVVGLIRQGDPKQAVIQRIRNTIKFCSSASFDDFSKMLRRLPSIIYIKDLNGRYVFCSNRWHHLRSPNESIRGLTDFDVRKSKENAEIARRSDLKIIRSGRGMSYMIKEEDEEGVEYLQVVKEPLLDRSGKVSGIIAIINNVTDSELLKEELHQKSITDQLTGVYNRFYFEELVAEMKGNIEMPLTLISADCDGLKCINDAYGHAAGDLYICFARDAILDALPKDAHLFRMGGDEFLALVPNMSKEDAKRLVEDILVFAKGYRTEQFGLRLSVGSFTIDSPGQIIEDAVRGSDKEMYRMKKSH